MAANRIRIEGIDRQRAGETADALSALVNGWQRTGSVSFEQLSRINDLYEALRDAERSGPVGTVGSETH
jgi:hypothetical protein